MKQNQYPKVKKYFTSPRLLVILTSVFVVVFIGLSKEIIKQYQIKKSVDQLNEQAQILESENKKLAKLLDLLNTGFNQEKESRMKLGLQKPGEKLVILSSLTNNTFLNQQQSINGKEEKGILSKWWSMFFGNNKD
ncbi:MAG: septum formation initiator family protein [Candidatus Aenigmarchaeota archaeon]|nr:septum formation initiator family protein [Candidatus Aenigmarchaeota archaeon]